MAYNLNVTERAEELPDNILHHLIYKFKTNRLLNIYRMK